MVFADNAGMHQGELVAAEPRRRGLLRRRQGQVLRD